MSEEFKSAHRQGMAMLSAAGIRISEEEAGKNVVNDFELGNFAVEGAQLLELLNTSRVGVRLIILLPGQTLPEHYHRAVEGEPGKEETVRMVAGTLYVGLPGEDNLHHATIPKGNEAYYTVRHEVVMKPCDQLTLVPGTLHWFQIGRASCRERV